MELVRVASYHAHPLLLRAFAERVEAARPTPDDTVVFTAHSLPKRVIDEGDRLRRRGGGNAHAAWQR